MTTKTTRIILCGLLVSTAASAQPADPEGGDQPAQPVDQPPPPPPPTVTVVTQPAPLQTTVNVDDGEVEERYRNTGLLFNLNNVFTAGGVLGGWQGFGFGAQKKLGSGNTARIGLDINRTTDPVNIVKTTRTNGMDIVTSYDLQLPGSGFSSQHSVTLALDIIKPLTKRSIAPYLGAGLVAGWSNRVLAYVDDLTVTDQVTEIDNGSMGFMLGGRGILGVAWQISERFSLFAEYHLTLAAIQWQADHTSTTVNNRAVSPDMEAASSRVETEFKETRWFNLDTGLGQGGALGLVAHF